MCTSKRALLMPEHTANQHVTTFLQYQKPSLYSKLMNSLYLTQPLILDLILIHHNFIQFKLIYSAVYFFKYTPSKINKQAQTMLY